MAVATGGAFRVPRDLEASFCARETICLNLRGRVADATLDDVLLVVSELVTNAVVHGQGEISVRAELKPGRVLGEVTDEGPGFEPKLRDSGATTAATDGLCIVDRLAQSWGVTDGAARVWFSIELARTDDGAWRRIPTESPC